MGERKNISNFLTDLRNSLNKKSDNVTKNEKTKYGVEGTENNGGLIKTYDSNGRPILINVRDFLQDEEFMLKNR